MDIVEVLKEEFTEFCSPVLINNLPSIDGLLPVQRKVIWALHINKINSDKQFIKLHRAGAFAMVFYIFGDIPLFSAMKNMANNGLNYFYLTPKGSYGDKRKKEDDGASPRYVECKLSPYSESMLEGINKNIVPTKRNFDNTEDEPILLPSIIPNILTNISQSIAVGEASKIPPHNLIETCNSLKSFILNKDIDKAIEILQCPDFIGTCGRIIYNKNTFNTIYKTGRGSFTLLGKYIYDEKESKVSIIEVPYEAYIEDIETKLIAAYDKGLFKEITHIHNNNGRQGIQLDIYLKKNTDLKQFEQKLRKYTPYESKFSCNFTVLDLDGKTPKLMSLKDIYIKWLIHRTTCIKGELTYDINKLNEDLNKLLGLELINQDLDMAIKLIRTSKTEKEAIDKLTNHFNLNQAQSEYVSTIRLININEDWILKKIKNVNEIKNQIMELQQILSSDQKIEDIIISQLENIKEKYGVERKTEIITDENIEDISKLDTVPDYNTKIIFTEQNWIKKIPLTSLRGKGTDEQKLKDNDNIIQEIDSTNKSTLYCITNKANRYKLNAYDISDSKPSVLGEYLPNLIDLEPNEKVIKLVSLEDETKAQGYILSVYENGKISKVDIKSFISANKKLQNCYSIESKLLDIEYIKNDVDVFMISQECKGVLVNVEEISSKQSRNSQGNQAMNLGESENNKVMACVINPSKILNFTITTEKGKIKEFKLDDIATTGKNSETRCLYEYLKSRVRNQGNFILNLRSTNDSVKEVKFE
jgi:DNA gyrase/topoisomerase IV subunit A